MSQRNSPDREDEFTELVVGRKYHHLTCVQVRPIVFRCECGKEVRGRSLTHLNDRLRSCGCQYTKTRTPRLRNEADFAEAARLHRVRLIGVLGAELKVRHRQYRVACLDCGREHELSHERFADPRPTLGGCQSCSAKVARQHRLARRDAWLGAG